MNVGMMPY